jgi:N-formylglutamate deformylase
MSATTTASTLPEWLLVRRGAAPLLLSMPHSGVEIPEAIERTLHSAWLGRCDTDWWIDRLYGFAEELDATIVRTRLSRTVIDVNRHPSGASLYPGRTTTELCPTTTFDGAALYREDQAPDAQAIAERRRAYFEPYHALLAAEITRLRAAHGALVLYDCHSIRSRVPRLFDGELPHLNLGTFAGASCAPELRSAVHTVCAAGSFSSVLDGRFQGGYITRHYGAPAAGVHALQMELACRGYLREPLGPVTASNWPVSYDASFAQPLQRLLRQLLETCLAFIRATPHQI